MRRSKSVTLRSTEAARAVSGVGGSARARNGFSETVCKSGRMPELDHTPPRGHSVRTIVCEQRPRSMSQVRTVESIPQLTPTRDSPQQQIRGYTRRERNTVEGAFVLAKLISSSTFRRFLRSGAVIVVSSETSSVSGIDVDHNPIKPSHPAARIFSRAVVPAPPPNGTDYKLTMNG